MLTLNDGRSELWQWDTGRKLTVDAECSQVHFSNKVFGRSIDMDVVDGVAIIPDILLQTDKELTAWAFVGTPENGYTKISKVFKVNNRNKPSDYVFTPPEQTTLAEIMERLDDLESTQDPDAIKNAVDDYLENNPVIVKETDPTVPEWAKQPDPPDVKIPDKLPNPYSITFTGAVNASYDGSDPVKINIPDSGGTAGFVAQPDAPEDTSVLWVDTDDDTEDVPQSGGIDVTGATVGQTVKISAVDENGVPTAWEPTDFPSGGEGKEWEEFLRFTTDNAETTVFDFSSNGTETLESKKVKEFYLYSPLIASSSDEVEATLLVNDYVKFTQMKTFCRTNPGILKLSLSVDAYSLKMVYFGRDTDEDIGSQSPKLHSVIPDGIQIGTKTGFKYVFGEQNGIPFPSAPVDYIKTVIVTLSGVCNSGVEFIVYVR